MKVKRKNLSAALEPDVYKRQAQDDQAQMAQGCKGEQPPKVALH